MATENRTTIVGDWVPGFCIECFSSKSDTSNYLISCMTCGIPRHQLCHGRAKLAVYPNNITPINMGECSSCKPEDHLDKGVLHTFHFAPDTDNSIKTTNLAYLDNGIVADNEGICLRCGSTFNETLPDPVTSILRVVACKLCDECMIVLDNIYKKLAQTSKESLIALALTPFIYGKSSGLLNKKEEFNVKDAVAELSIHPMIRYGLTSKSTICDPYNKSARFLKTAEVKINENTADIIVIPSTKYKSSGLNIKNLTTNEPRLLTGSILAQRQQVNIQSPQQIHQAHQQVQQQGSINISQYQQNQQQNQQQTQHQQKQNQNQQFLQQFTLQQQQKQQQYNEHLQQLQRQQYKQQQYQQQLIQQKVQQNNPQYHAYTSQNVQYSSYPSSVNSDRRINDSSAISETVQHEVASISSTSSVNNNKRKSIDTNHEIVNIDISANELNEKDTEVSKKTRENDELEQTKGNNSKALESKVLTTENDKNREHLEPKINKHKSLNSAEINDLNSNKRVKVNNPKLPDTIPTTNINETVNVIDIYLKKNAPDKIDIHSLLKIIPNYEFMFLLSFKEIKCKVYFQLDGVMSIKFFQDETEFNNHFVRSIPIVTSKQISAVLQVLKKDTPHLRLSYFLRNLLQSIEINGMEHKSIELIVKNTLKFGKPILPTNNQNQNEEILSDRINEGIIQLAKQKNSKYNDSDILYIVDEAKKALKENIAL